VTLTNTGTASLTISNVTTPSNFAQTNNCGTSLTAGASCTFQVTFTPTGSGAHTGNLNVFDNASGSPQKVSLTGTGTAIQLSPTSINFGTVKVGSKSNPQSVTMTNLGTSKVSITSITFTGPNPGDFTRTSTCGNSLSAGANCSISITFVPAAVGSRSASLSITDSGGGSPQTVALSGTGN
jgi:hypothetical protein